MERLPNNTYDKLETLWLLRNHVFESLNTPHDYDVLALAFKPLQRPLERASKRCERWMVEGALWQDAFFLFNLVFTADWPMSYLLDILEPLGMAIYAEDRLPRGSIGCIFHLDGVKHDGIVSELRAAAIIEHYGIIIAPRPSSLTLAETTIECFARCCIRPDPQGQCFGFELDCWPCWPPPLFMLSAFCRK